MLTSNTSNVRFSSRKTSVSKTSSLSFVAHSRNNAALSVREHEDRRVPDECRAVSSTRTAPQWLQSAESSQLAQFVAGKAGSASLARSGAVPCLPPLPLPPPCSLFGPPPSGAPPFSFPFEKCLFSFLYFLHFCPFPFLFHFSPSFQDRVAQLGSKIMAQFFVPRRHKSL